MPMYNSYQMVKLIGVHEMHGQMHPNYCQITILLAHVPLAIIISLPYDDPPPSHSQQFVYKNFGC